MSGESPPDTPSADGPRPAGEDADAARAALAEALRRVADGDRSALKLVYDRTAPKLYGICLRILTDRGDAEEALQDAFLKIWRNAGSFDPKRASPITWLATVTRNRAVDRFRARRPVNTRPIDAASEIAATDAPADAVIERDQEVAELIACLKQLEEKDEALIRAAFLQGSTYSELAERGGIPLGTVKSRVRRALAKLRGCLTP
ncbi:sigma-70 family RNA polymerase sigma factor [Allosphingosinicella indica]|uniref:RNA polymerase sigma-70 factor, ECF subfamily n=1 Tax=Allosphingosinicella indica TaxID=941907 RepID=A0A1X7GD76_9SPHN|nr:sigma-70 family RNA polymerase sigma factor [Allosphingosinicella indica]SMF67909.1 RNA polymerase sigma-70 factor, ECF subfamily [Allosphingosinicella indica]